MRSTLTAVLTLLFIMGLPAIAVAVNSITVESKEVATSTPGVTVGISVVNDFQVRQLALTLEVREVDPGAFITNSLILSIQGRVGASGLMDFPTLHYYATPAANTCSGPISHTFQDSASPDFVSPDAVYWLGYQFFGSLLGPGSDPAETPSFILTFDVGDLAGQFEIDTCCIAPAQHLMFADPSLTGYSPEFTMGVVTITGGTSDPPVAVCQPVSQDADGNCEADANIDNGSYDPDGGDVTLVQDPPGPYPLGETPVSLYVIDDEGDADTCEALVTVVDNTAPTASCPSDILVSNDAGTCGAAVDFTPVASDNCSGVTATSDPPSGSLFPVGITEVSVVAEDGSGNADTCRFNVTVEDAEPPVSICPGDTIVQVGYGTTETVVEFVADMADNCPGGAVVTDPPSGSAFLPGATPVECIGADAAGNADTCAFMVTVVVLCECPYQSDFDEDGFLTATDLARMIDVLFAGAPNDQDANCPTPRGDLDCDGFPTATDLSRLIDHLFAGGDGPCDPCAP